jgi:capsular exopolysaccharide synthesis family protein
MAQYDVTLRDYWRILRKRKVIVIFATVMLGLTSFATALVSRPDPMYRATAKVQYEKTQSAQQAYAAALGASDNLEIQQAVITSYPLVERIAQRLGLLDTVKATDEDRIKSILSLRPIIQTSVEGLTNIITITINHRDAFRARDIANAVAEEYTEYNFETKNAQLLQARAFIKTQRDTVEARLRAAQEKLKNFQEETQIVSVQARTSAILSQLSRVQDGLEALENVRSSILTLLAEYERTGDLSEGTLTSIPPEQGGGSFASLSSQLQSLNQERNRLLINYTEAHPQVQDVDSRKLAIVQNMIESLRIQSEVLARRIVTQKDMLTEVEARYQRLPEMGIELDELRRNINVQARLLAFNEQAYQESRIAQSEEVREVTVLQKALLPSSPTNPSTPTTTASVGALLGLILGVVFAFIAETLDTSIGTIEDVEEYLEVPVVGSVPHIEVDDVKEALGKDSAGQEMDSETLERRLRLAAHFEPRSTLAEAYRALRTNIQFANLEKGAKVISVTSASNQEGKSTTIANLGMTLAQAGNRVLLVDGDLRRPTIARIFGLDREPGITDVILGNYSWREVVRTVTDIMVGGLGMDDIMMTPGMDNLNIITSGSIPPNPSEITDSRRMTEFIEEVRSVYDVILFDSPPVLQATDATILGTKMDGVLLVYKIGQVSRGAIRRAKLQLDNVNVTVLGAVINGLRADVSEDFRDLRYYSYYSYGTETDEEGPPIERFYRRVKRELGGYWADLSRTVKPFVDELQDKWSVVRKAVDKHRGDGPEDAPEEAEEGEEEAQSRLLQILFWIFLLLFLSAGVLWQLGFLRPEPTSSQDPRPAMLKPNADTEELPTLVTRNTPPPPPLEAPVSLTAEAAALPKQVRKLETRAAEVKPSHRTTPAAPTAAVSAKSKSREPDARTPDFALHVASYKDRASADRMARKYAAKGHATSISRVRLPERGTFHRVLVGQFSTKRHARAFGDSLKAAGAIGYASVVRAIH